MAELEITVKDLEEGGKSYDLPVPAAWLDRVLGTPEIRAVPGCDGRVTFFASLSGSDVLVRGRLRASVVTPCARCLEDARVDIDAELTALFIKATPGFTRPLDAALSQTADQDDELELDREVYSGDTVVLDDLVREQIVVEIPMQVRCSDACPGVEVPAHVRGTSDPTSAEQASDLDPRLAPLAALARGLTVTTTNKKS